MSTRKALTRTEDGELRQTEDNTWAAETADHHYLRLRDNCVETATTVSTSFCQEVTSVPSAARFSEMTYYVSTGTGTLNPIHTHSLSRLEYAYSRPLFRRVILAHKVGQTDPVFWCTIKAY